MSELLWSQVLSTGMEGPPGAMPLSLVFPGTRKHLDSLVLEPEQGSSLGSNLLQGIIWDSAYTLGRISFLPPGVSCSPDARRHLFAVRLSKVVVQGGKLFSEQWARLLLALRSLQWLGGASPVSCTLRQSSEVPDGRLTEDTGGDQSG